MNRLRPLCAAAATALATAGLAACAEEAAAPEYENGAVTTTDGGLMMPGDQRGNDAMPMNGSMGTDAGSVERGERVEDMDAIKDPRLTPAPDSGTANPPG